MPTRMTALRTGRRLTPMPRNDILSEVRFNATRHDLLQLLDQVTQVLADKEPGDQIELYLNAYESQKLLVIEVVCSTCHGFGEVEYDRDDGNGHREPEGVEPCPDCSA